MKIMQGRVVSVIDGSTVAVEVRSLMEHPKYKKRITRTKTYLADYIGIVREDDSVSIVETRPISKRKRWRVQDVVNK